MQTEYHVYHTTACAKKKVTIRWHMRYNDNMYKGGIPVKIGLSTAAFYGRWETEEAAAHLSDYGAECAEAFLQTRGEMTRGFAEDVRQKLDGIPCTSMHPKGTLFENELFGRSPRQQAEGWDFFRRALDAVAKLGAAYYVYHGWHSSTGSKMAFDAQKNADIVGKMQMEAAKRGIRVAWENVSWCQLTTPERVTEMRRWLPDIGFTLDIKQAMRVGRAPIEFIGAMGGQLVNVHICDWQSDGALCLPGEGSFDFDAFILALKREGYDGPIIVEPYLALIRSDEKLRQSLNKMKASEEMADKILTARIDENANAE